MTLRTVFARIFLQEDVNFLLTNRIPRRLANRCMAWFSRIENRFLTRGAIGLWRFFGDLDLSDSASQRFDSVHECFTRALKPGARPIERDPRFLTSPCDAIIGACGRIHRDQLIQAKGSPYRLQELLMDSELAELYRDGQYVTLRLTSGMYHRFHSPYDCSVEKVAHAAGDTWNVNPIALQRIAKLFCQNERAVIRTVIQPSRLTVTMVPVAAILVGSIRLHFLDLVLNQRYRGPTQLHCQASFQKGEEMGWFEHGSTIIVFAPSGVTLCDSIREGAVVRMGRPLMLLPKEAHSAVAA